MGSLTSRRGAWLLLLGALTLSGGCPSEPPVEPRDVGTRVPRDADLPEPMDATFDAALALDASLGPDDVWLERTDGCTVPFGTERAGLPCDEAADCPLGLACLPPQSLEPSASCQLLAIEGCDCPAGTTRTPHVTAGAAFVVCALIGCPARSTEPGAIGRPCASLSDCPDWMICEAGPALSSCELPCSTQCTCPGVTSCVARARPDGVVERCE